MLKRWLKQSLKYLSKYIKLYIWYIILIFFSVVGVAKLNSHLSNYKADFTINNVEETDVESGRTAYNYFLDYSPSMKGFFDENVNSSMHMIAEFFEQVSADNENNHFYWCSNQIETVSEARTFYESMKSQQSIMEHYERIVENGWHFENEEEEFEGAEEDRANRTNTNIMNDMNLSKIFTENYVRNTDVDIDNLNVIITDMNFLQDRNDVETHNNRMQNLSQLLGQETSDKNTCIYAITTNYLGEAYDEAVFRDNTNNTTETFYLIIFSKDDEAYERYCQRFETFLSERGISITGKFELLNKLKGPKDGLEVDLNTYKNLNLITNSNINFASGLFDNLDANEFAIQLVSGSDGKGTLEMPVSEISLPGYYSADTKGYDDTRVEVEAEVYRPLNRPWRFTDIYEVYDDTTMISGKSAGIYYDDGVWYLRMNISMDTNLNIPDQASLLGQKKYLVLNLKFYVAEPSYSKPEWLNIINSTQMTKDGMLQAESVIDAIIRNKENSYALRPLEDGYLGNVVVYVLY